MNDSNEGNYFGSDGDEGKGKGRKEDEDDDGGGKHGGVEESKGFEPDDLPQNKKRRAREELPRDCCQNDDQNDGSENKEDNGGSTPKRTRVEGNSLGRRVPVSSVATVSVFDPKDSLGSPMLPPHGVPVHGR